MLTTEPTQEMVVKWKDMFEKHRFSMSANRKTGNELDAYFRNKYSFQTLEDTKFKRIVELNITENEYSKSKLPDGTQPIIHSYRVGDVFVGIDTVSGEFHVECTDIQKAELIYDDLFVYRGLDEKDLENFFLTAQYLTLTQS